MDLGGRLRQVGALVDSDIGGRGGSADESNSELTSVVFWGICDVKYDARLPDPRDRVRVLELGDGRTSRFSHHGRAIKENFDRKYCMDADPIKRAVMTENKKLTHDVFVQEGFAHLRPATAAYPRCYHAGLARQILFDLGLENDGAEAMVVLKLVNRSRGAGIIVVSGPRLDGVLQRVLRPPLKPIEVQTWMVENTGHEAMKPMQVGGFMEEQCLHWWSNESPLFLAERCCRSMPWPLQPDSNELFDGTMRVAFALYRKGGDQPQEAGQVGPFEIDWLGGYWKMPRAPVDNLDTCRLASLQESIISSFNSVDKRTAEASAVHLQEVYDALTPALPLVFAPGRTSLQAVADAYREDQLFCAFVFSRVAAANRVKDPNRGLQILEMAKQAVSEPACSGDVESLPELSVLSYIERTLGSTYAIKGDWEAAEEKWRSSLDYFPLNATTYWFQGCSHLERQELDKAEICLLKAISLDPDFKLPYLGLGNCRLLQRRFDQALDAALACLARHPDTPVAQQISGQAIYHVLTRAVTAGGAPAAPGGLILGLPRADVEEHARKALEIAKDRMPEVWSPADEKMLKYFRDPSARRGLPKAQVHTWKVRGWRP